MWLDRWVESWAKSIFQGTLYCLYPPRLYPTVCVSSRDLCFLVSFYRCSGIEYWRPGRFGSLLHTPHYTSRPSLRIAVRIHWVTADDFNGRLFFVARSRFFMVHSIFLLNISRFSTAHKFLMAVAPTWGHSKVSCSVGGRTTSKGWRVWYAELIPCHFLAMHAS